MIKLLDLLKEFEYGSQLFADIKDENLMNVEFLDAIASFRESECWIVGSDIPVSDLMIQNPIDRGFGTEVNELVQALKSKGV